MVPQLLPGFEATVDRVVYDPDLPASPDQPHPFIYYITILNGSDQTITVKGRKWVVRAENGQVTAVEGDGVVGCFPRLEPGEAFSYNSYHTTAGRAVAEGAYLALTEAGEAVVAKIPPFNLIPPGAL
ncbi:MAG: ApaG domain [bacterium]